MDAMCHKHGHSTVRMWRVRYSRRDLSYPVSRTDSPLRTSTGNFTAMSNPRAKAAPASQTKPPVYKNPATKVPAPSRTPARAASAPGKPRPGGLRPTPTKNPSAAARPPAQPAKANNWINRTVQSYVQSYGNYVGGYVNSIGTGVNKVGEGISTSISNTTRGWGQGVAGYGNNIKDQVGVGGPRVATAGNPLGLAGTGSATKSLPAPKKKPAANKRAGPGNPLGL